MDTVLLLWSENRVMFYQLPINTIRAEPVTSKTKENNRKLPTKKRKKKEKKPLVTEGKGTVRTSST